MTELWEFAPYYRPQTLNSPQMLWFLSTASGSLLQYSKNKVNELKQICKEEWEAVLLCKNLFYVKIVPFLWFHCVLMSKDIAQEKALVWPQHWEAWHHGLTWSYAGERPDKSGRICKPFKPHLVWGLCMQPQSFIIYGMKGLQHNSLFSLPWRSLIWTCCRVNIQPGGHQGSQMDSSHRPARTLWLRMKRQILNNLWDTPHQRFAYHLTA